MSSLNVAALSSVDIQKIKKEELTDIRSIKLDPSVPQDLRAVYVLKEMGNPYCYREGRTGDRFMSLCKSGQILNCCQPNALMTLTEYLVDYASEKTRAVGFRMIEEELKRIPGEKVRRIAEQNISDIKSSNRRDFRF